MSGLEDAITALRSGQLVVFPTDTVYGIACHATNPAAVGRLFEAKGRSHSSPLIVFVASVTEANRYAQFDERADRLARACWPGALTLVLPRSGESADWDLGGDGETIGLRIPAHPLARAVAAGVGPLAVSSANRSGEPTPQTAEAIAGSFGSDVEVYLGEAHPIVGEASTVVALASGELTVLREGSLSEARLRQIASGTA